MTLSDNLQALSVVSGAGLCMAGVYFAIKVDATTGAAMIGGGLAILGVKEKLGATVPPQTSQPATP